MNPGSPHTSNLPEAGLKIRPPAAASGSALLMRTAALRGRPGAAADADVELDAAYAFGETSAAARTGTVR
jgi:hypothetical protein